MERPIIFSGEMVKAILEGRKTMTRRVVTPQQENTFILDDIKKDPIMFWKPETPKQSGYFREGPYQRGMELWVRETWGTHQGLDKISPRHLDSAKIYYKADGPGFDPVAYLARTWRPSIFMPRWASRLTLEITDVRVERLQEISPEDAIAEGVEVESPILAVFKFSNLWDSINKKRGYGWDCNPWVWAISFKRAED